MLHVLKDRKDFFVAGSRYFIELLLRRTLVHLEYEAAFNEAKNRIGIRFNLRLDKSSLKYLNVQECDVRKAKYIS